MSITKPHHLAQRRTAKHLALLAVAGQIILEVCIRPAIAQTNLVLSFGGAGGIVTIPSTEFLQNADGFTLEAWIYAFAPSRTAYLFSKGDGLNESSSRSFDVGIQPADAIGPSRTDGAVFLDTNTYVTLSVPTPVSQWYHYAITFSSSDGDLRAYVNGDLKGVTQNSFNGGPAITGMKLRQTDLPLVLGGASTPLSRSFRGFMDEVRIWNRARTVDEIRSHVARTIIRPEPSLVASWNFDGGEASDVSGKGHLSEMTGDATIGVDSMTDLKLGMVAHYPLDGHANDQSENGNHGVIHGALHAKDRFEEPGSALYFDGNASYVTATLQNAPLGNSPRTLAAWFKMLPGSADNFPAFVSLGTGNCTNKTFGLGNNGQQLYFWSGCDDALTSLNFAFETWHLASIVYEGNAVRAYLDGHESREFTRIPDGGVHQTNRLEFGPLDTASGDLNLGFFPVWNLWFKGYLDDVRVFSRALSQWENMALYRTANPPAPLKFRTERLAHSASSGMRFSLEGTITSPTIIEASTNLIDWTPFLSLPAPVWPLELIDSTAKDINNRFYRARAP